MSCYYITLLFLLAACQADGVTYSIFTTVKPTDELWLRKIQLNTLRSWKALYPIAAEVVLLGHDQYSQDLALSENLRYEEIPFTSAGLPDIQTAFLRMDSSTDSDVVVFANSDILFTGALPNALEKAWSEGRRFCLTGMRKNTNVHYYVQFDQPWESWLHQGWSTGFRAMAQPEWALDYFAWSRGLATELNPKPLLLGVPVWDNYFLHLLHLSNVQTIDCSAVLPAVHQNHPLGNVTRRKELARQNQDLAGRWELGSLKRTSHIMTSKQGGELVIEQRKS